MAPATRARTRRGDRDGDGKPPVEETRPPKRTRGGKRPNPPPPVQTTRPRAQRGAQRPRAQRGAQRGRGIRVGTRGDGEPQTIGEQPNPPVEEIEPWANPYLSPHGSWRTFTYPDRNEEMERCYTVKQELLSGKELEDLETTLSKMKQGLTYKTAIEQLIQGSLDDTLKKDVSREICRYVAWWIGRNSFIMHRLVTRVEKWDDDVIQLMVDVVDNLNKDIIVLDIPGLAAISSIARNCILGQPLDDCSRGSMVDSMKKLVERMDFDLIYPDRKMEAWAKHPTWQIDIKMKLWH